MGENAKAKASTELKAETEKRVELENKVMVDRLNFEHILVSLTTKLHALTEDFQTLKVKSDAVHDTWFDETDDHTQANKFINDYESKYGSGDMDLSSYQMGRL